MDFEGAIGILDLSNKNNTNFYEKLIFRVKVPTFKIGNSQTLNPSVDFTLNHNTNNNKYINRYSISQMCTQTLIKFEKKVFGLWEGNLNKEFDYKA